MSNPKLIAFILIGIIIVALGLTIMHCNNLVRAEQEAESAANYEATAKYRASLKPIQKFSK